MSPGAGAVSFMFLEFAKILLSVAMLVMAPKVVPDLNWFAVLAGLVAGLKVYWFALLWRGR
jgi:ATP synthase protein I